MILHLIHQDNTKFSILPPATGIQKHQFILTRGSLFSSIYKTHFMKPLITLLLVSGLFITARAQQPVTWCNFEDSCNSHFIIDSVSHHHNSWQIGRPAKAVFDSAFSAPNVIVTDTVAPYPVNDTSVFTLSFPGFLPVNSPWWLMDIQFAYQLDRDSSELAIIELSSDSGQHWSIVNSDTFGNAWTQYHSLGPLHDTSQWDGYYMSFPQGGVLHGNYMLRFTFISDSVQTNKDGWELDDFMFEYWMEGVNEVKKIKLVDVFPNPSSGAVQLQNLQGDAKAAITVYSIDGRKVYETQSSKQHTQLDLPLPNGQYLLKYTTGQASDVSRITISR